MNWLRGTTTLTHAEAYTVLPQVRHGLDCLFLSP